MPDPALGSVVSVLMGQSPPGTTCSDAQLGVPLLNGPTEFGEHHPTPRQWTTDGRRMCREHAVLLCVRGSTTGRTNRADRAYAIGRGVAAIEADDPVDQTYVYYALLLRMSRLLEKTTGSVFPNLARDDIEALPIPWPSRAIRQAAGGVLRALDDKIEANRRAVVAAGQLLLARYDQATAECLPVNSTAVLEPILGGTPSRAHPEYWGGTLPWAAAKDVVAAPNGIILETAERISEVGLADSPAKLASPGTTLITARGTVGCLARTVTPCSFNQTCYALEPRDGFPALLVYLAVRQGLHGLGALTHGTIFSTITKPTFDVLQLRIPARTQWHSLVAELAPVDKYAIALSQETRALASMSDVLVPTLLNGVAPSRGESLRGEQA